MNHQTVFLILALVLVVALLAKALRDMFSRRSNSLGAEMATQYIRNRELLAEWYLISSETYRSVEEARNLTTQRD